MQIDSNSLKLTDLHSMMLIHLRSLKQIGWSLLKPIDSNLLKLTDLSLRTLTGWRSLKQIGWHLLKLTHWHSMMQTG